MPYWLLIFLKKIVAPFVVSEAIDYAKEQLLDKEVDEAIERVSQVAQKLQLVQDRESADSPIGHIDDETKAKAVKVLESVLDIAAMIDISQ